MTLSEVQGVYNAKNVYPNGKVEQVSSGHIDKNCGRIRTIRFAQNATPQLCSCEHVHCIRLKRIIRCKFSLFI